MSEKLPNFGGFRHQQGVKLHESIRKKINEKMMSGDELYDLAAKVYDKIELPKGYTPDEFNKLIVDKKRIKKALKVVGVDTSKEMVDKVHALIKADVEEGK